MLARLLLSVSLAVPLAVPLALPLAASAGTAEPPQGVWTGTLGTKAIVACFNGGVPGAGYASYYYRDYLKPILLRFMDKEGVWQEEKETGSWTLSAPVKGVVKGQWRHPKTGKLLPIRLENVEEADNEEACGGDAYNERLETLPPVVRGPLVTFAPGRVYRKLTFAGQETIELQGSDAATARLNDELKLDESSDAVSTYFAQRREFLGRVGYPAVDERHTEPKFWDGNFITIEFYSWAAGEGRRGISIEHRTWNTRTGEPVDPWTWIGVSQEQPQLPAPLKKYLYRGVKDEGDCLPTYQGKGDYRLTFDHKGLHLEEEAWGNGCEKSFDLPFDKAGPYLTPAGKQAAAALQRGR